MIKTREGWAVCGIEEFQLVTIGEDGGVEPLITVKSDGLYVFGDQTTEYRWIDPATGEELYRRETRRWTGQ